MDFVNPPRIMVARFGHIDSLVENFNLSSKMDPNAFASFRLPAVIGGASVNIAALVADNITDSTSPMLGDIRAIMEEGLIAPKQALSNLSIIELKQDRELNKELNLKVDENYYTLDDLFTFLKLSKTKINECKVRVKMEDDSTVIINFHEGKLVLKSDFTFDWEI